VHDEINLITPNYEKYHVISRKEVMKNDKNKRMQKNNNRKQASIKKEQKI